MVPGESNQPLRTQIESTRGDTAVFEDLVRNYLGEEASKGRDLAGALRMNGFEEAQCSSGLDKCFYFETKGLIQKSIFVKLSRSNDKSPWSVSDVAAGFTGP
jgi:hypothetical protein